jgi:NhaP-type Na+/H+ or K+/H+ antiporter
MLTGTLVLLGLALLTLALADRPVQRLPLTPALVYLLLGLLCGLLLAEDGSPWLIEHARALRSVVEFMLLASLQMIGLRLRLHPTLAAWRVALLLAGPGMVATVAVAALFAMVLLGLPWPAALLTAAVLAPTDPVLASEVQIRSEADRDAVRLSLSAEGGLNDGTALPLVMLALGWMGLHALGKQGWRWWWADLTLPIAGGALAGVALGWLLGHSLRLRLAAGDALARDELIHVGAVALSFGLAHALGLSTFIVAFAVGATLLLPLSAPELAEGEQALARRLQSFGSRFERLVEAASVLAVGVLLGTVQWRWAEFGFALLLVFVARPLAVLAVVWPRHMPGRQRRLLAWFGIRGVGSLYYLLWALEQGVAGDFADQLVRVTLMCVAVSILLHGVSATPAMNAYQRGSATRRGPPLA